MHVAEVPVQSAIAKGQDVNAQRPRDAGALLHCASDYGHRDVCVLLLAAGADPVGRQARLFTVRLRKVTVRYARS